MSELMCKTRPSVPAGTSASRSRSATFLQELYVAIGIMRARTNGIESRDVYWEHTSLRKIAAVFLQEHFVGVPVGQSRWFALRYGTSRPLAVPVSECSCGNIPSDNLKKCSCRNISLRDNLKMCSCRNTCAYVSHIEILKVISHFT